MKSKFAPSLFGAISFVSVLTAGLSVMQVQAGETIFYVTEDGSPVSDLAITVDGKKKLVRSNGFISFDIKAGDHQVEFSQLGEWAGDVEFTTTEDQNAEVQVELVAGEALAEVNVFAEDEIAAGTLSGYLISEETGSGIVGATVSLSKELTVITNQQGYFEFEVPRGSYEVMIDHQEYGQKKIRNLRVLANVATEVNVDLSMSGDSVIEEVVAIGTYVADTITAQERDSSAVLDAIGSEQFSRFGDSNAASALKRVSGVTIADGKYAVVRGLNERYTTVTFNGANLPSPDPSRRVVPLDIFPSGLISGINVQKSATADRFSDSAGANIDILSKEAPDAFSGKLKVSLGFVDGLTGTSQDLQTTSGSEILGFGSDDRDLTSQAKSLASADNKVATGSEAADLLDLSQLETEKQNIRPDMSLELSIGDMITETDSGFITYKWTGKYSNEWNLEESDRATYDAVGNGDIQEADEYTYERVTNDITLATGLSLSYQGEDTNLYSNSMMLRQTQNDNVLTKGIRGENRDFIIEKEYAWREREFLMQQFVGEHYFSMESFFDLETDLDWALTVSQASLNSPDTRSYEFVGPSNIATDETFNPLAVDYSSVSDLSEENDPTREFSELTDDSTDFYLKGNTLLLSTDEYEVRTKFGLSTFSRKRVADNYTYQYELATDDEELPAALNNIQTISNILTDDAFSNGIYNVKSNTNYENSYEGTWDYSAFFIQPKFEIYDLVSAEIGLRLEDSDMSLETKENPSTGSNVTADVTDNDAYTSLNVTYHMLEDVQARFAYYNSINRPDFREVAPAQFTDPVSGDLYQGNPLLTSSTIDNLDLRFEYYLSDSESITAAAFRKDFTDIIERTVSIVSGSSNSTIYRYDNGGDAFAQGIEFSFSKDISFDNDFVGLKVSGNASFIDSEVEELNASGNVSATRQMQGQPDMLANLQLEADELESGREYTLVLNYTGESLDSVSASEYLPDFMKASRAVLDISFKQPIIYDELEVKATIKNITNSEVLIEQGGRMVKRYKPGSEFKLGLTYNF
jgi:TonB-dependent receptor